MNRIRGTIILSILYVLVGRRLPGPAERKARTRSTVRSVTRAGAVSTEFGGLSASAPGPRLAGQTVPGRPDDTTFFDGDVRDMQD